MLEGRKSKYLVPANFFLFLILTEQLNILHSVDSTDSENSHMTTVDRWNKQ